MARKNKEDGQPVLTGNQLLEEARKKAELLKQKPPEVLSAPLNFVKGLQAAFIPATPAQRKIGITDVFVVTDEVPEVIRLNHQRPASTRTLISYPFRDNRDDALEVSGVQDAVAFLHRVGAFDENHVEAVLTAVSQLPAERAERTTRMTDLTLRASRRTSPHHHSVKGEWVDPLVTPVVTFIKKISLRKK